MPSLLPGHYAAVKVRKELYVTFRRFLLEVSGLRYDERSTIFCTQYRQKDWHARLGADVTAEAIMDRIVHKTAWAGMGEMNMRAAIGTAASSSPRS